MNVVVAAWVGSANAGDELLFTALRRKLAERGADATVVSVDPEATRRAHGVTAVPGRNLPAVASAIRRADAMVFGGGGLLQDETSHLNLPYHLSRVWAARSVRTPFAGVGLGAGALRTRFARRLVRRSLRGARGVAVRDRGSAELLASLGVPGVVEAADLAFSLPAPSVPAADRLAVCLRPWPGRTRLLPMSVRWRQDLRADRLLEAFAARLDQITDATGLEVRFIPFHRGRDDALHRLVADRMRSAATFAEAGPEDLAAEIGSARAAVTMRYHGAVLAAMSGRPVVVVGGSDKLRCITESLGGGAARISRDAGSLAALPESLERVLPAEAAVREAAEALRERERRNDEVLDRLLG